MLPSSKTLFSNLLAFAALFLQLMVLPPTRTMGALLLPLTSTMGLYIHFTDINNVTLCPPLTSGLGTILCNDVNDGALFLTDSNNWHYSPALIGAM